jgi:HprK-related kinase A
MTLGDLHYSKVEKLLVTSGLLFQTGRFVTRLRSNIKNFAKDLIRLYGDTPLISDALVDFNIELQPSKGLHRWYHPQVNFSFNGISPFAPLPIEQSLPLLEWGLNWCVSSHYHNKLLIHAAVVEKYGRAIVLPGQPGAGKSTLCAALVLNGGFRLLSDELTMLDLQTGEVWPNPRPISLKNKAIEIIKTRSPKVNFSTTVADTVKGSVSLVCPPLASIESVETPARPGLIIFPRFNKDLESYQLTQLSKGKAFIELANQSFNYAILTEQGFLALGKHLDEAECFEFVYDGDLNLAVDIMNELIRPE